MITSNSQPFYKGQQVVCVKQHKSGIPKKDKVYTVNSIYTCPQCGAHYVDYGVPHGYPLYMSKMTCVGCKHVEVHPKMENEVISASYFAPIEPLYADIRETLAKEAMNVHDTADQPIKELINSN